MPDKAFLLPPFFDYSATFLWAISGAVLAARRGYAILGIVTIALVSSTGGGLLRDGLFIQDGLPVLLRTPIYLWLIAAAVLLVVLFGRWIDRMPGQRNVIVLIDALGLGAYAVVGMCRALGAGVSLPGVVVVGMVNAVGGGILRDVLLNSEPDMFKPGTLDQVSALIGCLLFLGLTQALPFTQFSGAWITIGTVFAIRLLAIRFGIETRPLPSFKAHWDRSKDDRDDG
jgi:uncharacterized membrane protein YeiH